MTKKEVRMIIDLVFKYENEGVIVVEKNVQSVVNEFVDTTKKLDPSTNYYQIKKKFEYKSNNFISMFQHAFRRKAKKSTLNEIEAKKILGDLDEEKYLISKCAKMLKMTPQNLNAILRNHPEIEVIQESARRRFLTKSQMDKIRTI